MLNLVKFKVTYKSHKRSDKNIKQWKFSSGKFRKYKTFFCSIFSLKIDVNYIHKPFDAQCELPVFKRWYPYIRPGADIPQARENHSFCQSLLNYNLTLKHKIPKPDSSSLKFAKSIVVSLEIFDVILAKLNPFHTAAILKEKIGLFLTEDIALNLGVKPVIVIKPTLSFFASLKRVNWWYKLSKIHDRPHLIEDYLLNEIAFITTESSDPVLSASAYWRAVHKLLEQASRYPDWSVMTHEKLSQEPVDVFQHLHEMLNLPCSESVKNKIIKLTQGNRAAIARKSLVQDVKRNSASILTMHHASLSLEERKTLFKIV